VLASQIRLITPALATAATLFGAAGGKVSFGVMQIGSLGSLSMTGTAAAAAPVAATLRTTKHCSLPASAPGWVKVGSVSGAALSGTGAAGRSTGTPVGTLPAAGTE